MEWLVFNDKRFYVDYYYYSMVPHSPKSTPLYSSAASDVYKSQVNDSEDSNIKSIGDIKKVLEPLVVPPTKEDDPDFYLDYGSDTSYHTKTGKGECAA